MSQPNNRFKRHSLLLFYGTDNSKNIIKLVRKLGFTYECENDLSHTDTIKRLKTIAKNADEYKNGFLLYIQAQWKKKEFNIGAKTICVETILDIFQTMKEKDIQVNLFFNGFNYIDSELAEKEIFFQRDKNTFVFYNSHSVNWHRETLLQIRKEVFEIDFLCYSKIFQGIDTNIDTQSSKFKDLTLQLFSNVNDLKDLNSFFENHLNNRTYRIANKVFNPIGKILIFNYIQDVQIDENIKMLKDMFANLNFSVQFHDILTFDETVNVIQRDDHSFECFAIFIIADYTIEQNSAEAAFKCKDGALFYFKDLFKLFTTNEGFQLKYSGKPKLLFVQSRNEISNLTRQKVPTRKLHHCEFNFGEDFIVFLCTQSEFNSPTKKLTFIEVLNQLFSEHSENIDVLTLLKIAFVHINSRSNDICFLQSSLKRLLFLNTPKLYNEQLLYEPEETSDSDGELKTKKSNDDSNNNRPVEHKSVESNNHSQSKYKRRLDENSSGLPRKKLAASDSNYAKYIIFDNLKYDNTNKIKGIIKQFNSEADSIYNDFSKKEVIAQLDKDLNEKTNCSYLVVCIFAPLSNNDASQLSFTCKGEQFCLQELTEYFTNFAINRPNTQIYVLINANTKTNKFHLFKKLSNVFISFNTYPQSFTVELLLKKMQKSNEYLDENNYLKIIQKWSQALIESSKHKIDRNKFSGFIEKMFSVFTNSNKEMMYNSTGYVKEQYDLPYKNSVLFMLDFNLDFRTDKFIRFSPTPKSDFENAFKSLGFIVYSLTDQKMQEFMNGVSEFDLSSTNCLILCLMTCFENEKIFVKKDEAMKLEKIINWFNDLSKFWPKVLLIHNKYHQTKANKTPQESMNSLDLIKIPEHFIFVYYSFNDDKQNPISNCFLKIWLEIVEKYALKYDLMRMFQMASIAINQYNKPCLFINSTLESLAFFKKSDTSHEVKKLFIKGGFSRLMLESTKKKISRDYLKKFYPINKRKCLLVNYSCYDETLNKKSIENVNLLTNAFRSINIEVEVIEDKEFTSWEILGKKSIDPYTNLDCMIVCIITNGNSICVDRNELFNGFAELDFNEKPKLFFVFDSPPDDVEPDGSPGKKIEQKLMEFSASKYANFLYFYSSDAFKSIEILCNELEEHPNHFDLNESFTNVFRQIKSKNDDSHKCYLNSTLGQMVNFNESPKNENFNFETIDKKSVCFILNNETYPNEKLRNGTTFDVDRLKNFFKFKLNFDFTSRHDLSREEVLTQLDIFSKTDYSVYGCFVFFALAHGSKHGIIKCKNGNINQDDIINALALNPTLKNKPIIVFINACQGPIVYDNKKCFYEVDGKNTDHQYEQLAKTTKWNYPNLFVFLSSYPGSISYRDPQRGSYFIQNLCEVFENQYDKLDLASMAAIVTNKITYGCESRNGNKQIPFVHSTMTKKIKFAKAK